MLPGRPSDCMSGVETDPWPSRLSQAVAQLARGTLDSPLSQASWISVIRRALVVSGFTAYAVLTNNLDTAIFAAFGALQIGLGEAAMPLRRLIRLVLLSTLGIVIVAGTGLWLSGTWWTVLLLTIVAFLQGASANGGVIPRTVGIGALALGVIFAGLDADPVTATMWLAIGAVTQSLFWLLLWHRERAMAVRRSIRNALVKVNDIVQAPGISGATNNAASEQVDHAVSVINDSGVTNRAAALRITALISELRHTVVAWRELRGPGLAERLRITERLNRCARAIGTGRPWVQLTSHPYKFVEAEWPVSHRLDQVITELDEAVVHLEDVDAHPVPAPVAANWSPKDAFTPGTQEFRHGMRMAVAIAIAQSLSLLLPLTHSFWIPLTCVFVVKPDWAFTLTRSVARVSGNLLAVLLIPALLYVAGPNQFTISFAVFIISSIAFHFFTGNYIVGSFGIAGTILILDQILARNPELYTSRIISTLIGAAVGIAVSALIPSWRGNEAVQLLRDVAAGLAQWSQQTTRGLLDPASLDESAMQQADERERNNLIRLRPAVEAAMLEPRPEVDPRCLSVALDAAARAHLTLVALAFQARLLNRTGAQGLDVAEPAVVANASFTQACSEVGVDVPADTGAVTAVDTAAPPRSAEDAAVLTEALRLAQAAGDFAEALGWVAGYPSARTQ